MPGSDRASLYRYVNKMADQVAMTEGGVDNNGTNTITIHYHHTALHRHARLDRASLCRKVL